jgi:hypothetical protein
MTETHVAPRTPIGRLIFWPAMVTLALTILRLTGELHHWSGKWFSTETGGTTPHGVSWVVGITWLAAPIGVYFAVRLTKAQQGPTSHSRALVLAALGLCMMVALRMFISTLPLSFPTILIPIWLFMAIAGIIQYFGWPALFRSLLLYGLAARIPVAVVMFLAMRGNWGTHYDYVGMPPRFDMPLVPKFLWLALVPQLVFWVAFTIVAGSVCGALTTALVRLKPPSPRIDVS